MLLLEVVVAAVERRGMLTVEVGEVEEQEVREVVE